MKSLALTLLAVGLFATPTLGGDSEVDYIDGVVQGAVTDLEATYADTDVAPACRGYADALVTTLALVTDLQSRPDSAYIPQLFDAMVRPLAKMRNACLLAT